MGPSLRSLLLGSDAEPTRRVPTALLPLAAFAATFALYALGVFRVSGGVVFPAADAAAVGALAALVVGTLAWTAGTVLSLAIPELGLTESREA